MRKLTLLVLVLASLIECSAQPTFMRMFPGIGTAKGHMMELSDGKIKAGITVGIGTSIMDAQGNILQSHIYEVDTFLAMQAVKKFSDSEFPFVGAYRKDTCSSPIFGTAPRWHPAIGWMDSLGNVQAVNHYVLNWSTCNGNAGDLEVTDDKEVITWGRDDMFALCVDSTGAVNWSKQFAHIGAFRFIKKLPGGDLLAGINMDTAGAVVARLDPNGNFLWCKSYVRPQGLVTDCVIESDDSFVITGFTDNSSLNFFTPLPPEYRPKLFMLKLNGTGEVQWCKGYDSTPNLWFPRRGVRIERTQDENYVLLANLGVENYNSGFRPLLMKTDLNGDTLWTRSNGRSNYRYEPRNLLTYSDGGIIYTGLIYGDLPDNESGMTFLFKTDSLGHLPCFERTHPIQVLDLFPVDSSFTLTYTEGAVMRYAIVEDAPDLPITMYDGCSFSTDLPPWQRNTRKMTVRPNPNTGRFTVEFRDPLMAQSYYSVYDAMGQLLYQRPLPVGQRTEEVDLSRYSAGTYVIKFTSPEGTCYERVVVE